MKKILLENENFKIELEDGILFVLFKDFYIDINIAEKGLRERLEISDGKKYPLLINIKSMKSITKETRDFLATEKGCEGVIAGALLIDSAIGSMLGNFFIRISRPLVPTKLFTNESAAKKWLAKYVSKD